LRKKKKKKKKVIFQQIWKGNKGIVKFNLYVPFWLGKKKMEKRTVANKKKKQTFRWKKLAVQLKIGLTSTEKRLGTQKKKKKENGIFILFYFTI